jgi:hypothetical protein
LVEKVLSQSVEYDQQSAYGTGAEAHNSGGEVNAELMQRWGLTEWAGREFVLTGPEEQIAARLRELIDAGARSLRIPITLREPAALARQAARIIGLALSSRPAGAGSPPPG